MNVDTGINIDIDTQVAFSFKYNHTFIGENCKFTPK